MKSDLGSTNTCKLNICCVVKELMLATFFSKPPLFSADDVIHSLGNAKKEVASTLHEGTLHVSFRWLKTVYFFKT